ncbi:hypothetical protein Y032_0332g2773 [Ancylostoma ceylanicum]|uniref:CUE domain-containing protein n=1 Tax=Ancylostoma ceylanicum TaxID=53326 RepID=A0A016S071_9BILA|nr:hypothetical protein Y032_0332g2773 [Ancylostoma ceylanicum]
MDYEATVKYLKCLFPKVSSEELCWAYIESDGNIDRAAGLILDGQVPRVLNTFLKAKLSIRINQVSSKRGGRVARTVG